ncbi:hypothetical protein GCM10011609_06570 [Lentzea pudingi]|uniref:Cation/H+ exchanger transmembrane domain-containing protein n=1 Tax=Lentzea pudingi TaxID=1789439 RepID=A0ABQ2HC11_9PSEU|nr:cation:proton antiporter [Lentzea pudingi]GGM73454.1 hypothetical protein GCM10011609_06570 [Lentzea pudingi]
MPRRWGIGAVYLLLIIVPAVATVLVLGAGKGASSAAAPQASHGFPVYRLLIAIVVIILCCKLAGFAMRALRQPRVVGEIAAGLLLGPTVFGAVWPDAHAALFPSAISGPLTTLAQLGVVLFVFLAGLEIDPKLLRGNGNLTATVSLAGLAVPMLFGALFAVASYSSLAPGDVGLPAFALFIGIAMSVTALPVLADMLRDSPLAGSPLAVVALACATIDDVVAWILLAVVVSLLGGVAGGFAATIGLTAGFVLLLVFAVRPLLTTLLTGERLGPGGKLAVLLLGALSAAAVTDWIGIHAVIGAFAFGLAVPRVPGLAERTTARVGSVTGALLLPLFFAVSGLNADLSGLGGALWGWVAFALAVAVLGKVGSAALAARAVGTRWSDSLTLGWLMNCRGLTELVVLDVGLRLGVLSPAAFTVLMITALVCTAMTGPAIATAKPPVPVLSERT